MALAGPEHGEQGKPSGLLRTLGGVLRGCIASSELQQSEMRLLVFVAACLPPVAQPLEGSKQPGQAFNLEEELGKEERLIPEDSL